ncbi:MAG: glycosyltransferase [Pirellulaceae bacterium]
MSVRIEVAICTRNRAQQLRQTLQSVQQAIANCHQSCRLILIDNASTDRTTEVAREFVAQGLPMELIHEAQPGHTHARNRAISASQAELVVWTDDDVVVESDWLNRYWQAFETAPSDSFWGSAIVPVFAATKPIWIDENWDKLSGAFAARDLGDEAVAFTENRLPYGANFAVRGDVLRQFQFDASLGRSDRLILGEDEIEYLQRYCEQGFTAVGFQIILYNT